MRRFSLTQTRASIQALKKVLQVVFYKNNTQSLSALNMALRIMFTFEAFRDIFIQRDLK